MPIGTAQLGSIAAIPLRNEAVSAPSAAAPAATPTGAPAPAKPQLATFRSGYRSMSVQPPRDENPCRPRHFKPDPCGPAAPAEGPARRSLDQSHTRLLITAALFGLAFAVIAVRLVDVTAFGARDTNLVQREPAAAAPASRADIVDRNGVLLATTLDTPSLFADPQASCSTPRTRRASSPPCCPTSTRRSWPQSSARARASSG